MEIIVTKPRHVFDHRQVLGEKKWRCGRSKALRALALGDARPRKLVARRRKSRLQQRLGRRETLFLCHSKALRRLQSHRSDQHRRRRSNFVACVSTSKSRQAARVIICWNSRRRVGRDSLQNTPRRQANILDKLDWSGWWLQHRAIAQSHSILLR